MDCFTLKNQYSSDWLYKKVGDFKTVQFYERKMQKSISFHAIKFYYKINFEKEIFYASF